MEAPLRNIGIRRLSFVVVIVGVLGGLTLIGAGAYLLMPEPDTHGALLIAGGLILAAMAALGHAAVLLALKAEGNINRIHNDVLDLLELLRRVEPQVKTISDNSQISDRGRSIANREKERDALRQAIREEMYGGDWEAAIYLVDEMERRFGYAKEAKQIRAELNEAREMTIEEKISEVISHINEMTTQQKWDRARVEAERLIKLFPHHEKIKELPAELARKRDARKQELLAEWRSAVERDEIDRGIAILTELDQYLTRAEAQSLQDSARHVFKARLLNLGVQFGLAASEARWRDALEVGLQLRQEFPNSRMAQEVGEKLDTLRARAGFVADAEVIQQRRPVAP